MSAKERWRLSLVGGDSSPEMPLDSLRSDINGRPRSTGNAPEFHNLPLLVTPHTSLHPVVTNARLCDTTSPLY